MWVYRILLANLVEFKDLLKSEGKEDDADVLNEYNNSIDKANGEVIRQVKKEHPINTEPELKTT